MIDFFQYLEMFPQTALGYEREGMPMTSRFSDPAASKYDQVNDQIVKVRMVLADPDKPLTPKYRDILEKHLQELKGLQSELYRRLTA